MNENINETMGAIIARKRKELGLTQEQLAGELNISYQAVSKWENELSSPDISTLPLLADTLGLTIDELFGREAAARETALAPIPAPAVEPEPLLPWPDDETLHAVLFVGHTLVGHESAGDRIFSKRQVSFQYEGPALNVQSDFSVTVEGNVQGDVTAGGNVDCEDVGGSVTAGGSVDCEGVTGSVQAGGDVDCGGVGGSVTAGGDVDCGAVGDNVHAEGDVDCGVVGGSVTAGGDVDCGTVIGKVNDSDELHSNLKGAKKGFSFELKL